MSLMPSAILYKIGKLCRLPCTKNTIQLSHVSPISVQGYSEKTWGHGVDCFYNFINISNIINKVFHYLLLVPYHLLSRPLTAFHRIAGLPPSFFTERLK
jgi:hypothetical protein